MIEIYKIIHKGEIRIMLKFEYDIKVIQQVKTIPTALFSKTIKAWHIAYEPVVYQKLKSLGLKIIVIKDSGTTSNGDHTSIEPSSPTVPSQIPKDRDADIIVTKRRIVLNNQSFRLSFPYNKNDVDFVKTLEQSYWHDKYKVWVIKASIINLRALQDKYQLWDSEAYEKHLELISLVDNPRKLELFITPEHKNKVMVRLKGFRIDIDFMKHISERSYDRSQKRWTIPNEAIIIDRIIAHYKEQGVEILNRIPQKSKHYYQKDRSLKEKQIYLLGKYDIAYRPVLEDYTNTLIAQRYSWRTVESYTKVFGRYLIFVGVDKLARVDEKTVMNYLAIIAGRKVSESTINVVFSALKLYYQKVIFRPDFQFKKIKRPRKGSYLPTILSVEEVERILRALTNLKHKTLLYTIYSGGMRLGEVLSLRVNDLLWDRNQIFIKAGKGKKDRMVTLSSTLKEIIKLYIDKYQPEYWLFEGQDRQHQYSSSSLQKVVKNATAQAGITRRVSPHTLRHCYATHLMDSGVGIRYIQELLGHKDIKTTLIYTHVTTANATSITSPLDKLSLNE